MLHLFRITLEEFPEIFKDLESEIYDFIKADIHANTTKFMCFIANSAEVSSKIVEHLKSLKDKSLSLYCGYSDSAFENTYRDTIKNTNSKNSPVECILALNALMKINPKDEAITSILLNKDGNSFVYSDKILSYEDPTSLTSYFVLISLLKISIEIYRRPGNFSKEIKSAFALVFLKGIVRCNYQVSFTQIWK